jgi:hypothetical protein
MVFGRVLQPVLDSISIPAVISGFRPKLKRSATIRLGLRPGDKPISYIAREFELDYRIEDHCAPTSNAVTPPPTGGRRGGVVTRGHLATDRLPATQLASSASQLLPNCRRHYRRGWPILSPRGGVGKKRCDPMTRAAQSRQVSGWLGIPNAGQVRPPTAI